MSEISNASGLKISQLRSIHAMQELIRVAQKAFDNQDFQAPMLLVFLEIGRQKEYPMADLVFACDITHSTVSRIIAKLGRGMPRRNDGLELIESYEDPGLRRRKLIRLTEKGQQVYDVFMEVLEESLKPKATVPRLTGLEESGGEKQE
jgi:DNA-binding MarR family transcriptional regulator